MFLIDKKYISLLFSFCAFFDEKVQNLLIFNKFLWFVRIYFKLQNEVWIIIIMI